MATFIVDMGRLDPHIIRTNLDQITDLLTAEVDFNERTFFLGER